MNISMWTDLMKSFGFDQNENEFYRVHKAYSQKNRHYHNTDHIVDCLNQVDTHKEIKANHHLKLAIWYHDVIYNAFSKNNELKSAELLIAFLENQNATEELKTDVYNLIMATIHTKEPKNLTEAYMMDIDISILGADAEKYDNYTKLIRKEYKMVPWFMYKKKRIEVMQQFLKRKKIYFTDHYYTALEAKARANIAKEIEQLA